MGKFVRSAAALSIACLVASMAIVFAGGALAQATQQAAPVQGAPQKLPPVKQMALTEKQIRGLLAASKDINSITDSAPEDINRLTPKTTAQLDVVARRNGLASYDEYNSVDANIGLVTGGFDPVTRKYLGKEALVKVQMAQIRADKKMSAADKEEALQSLKDDLQLPLPPVQYKGNIDLVAKYYDQIVATMRGD